MPSTRGRMLPSTQIEKINSARITDIWIMFSEENVRKKGGSTSIAEFGRLRAGRNRHELQTQAGSSSRFREPDPIKLINFRQARSGTGGFLCKVWPPSCQFYPTRTPNSGWVQLSLQRVRAGSFDKFSASIVAKLGKNMRKER